MSVSIRHAKVSGKAAGNDPTRVYGTHWDEEHVVPVATNEEAQAGTSDDVLMTPEKTLALVDANTGSFAVRYDEAQSITGPQKQQARENIAAVGYDAQTLTDEQQEQARENVGLKFTGSDTSVAPALNATSFLDLLNTYAGAQYVGSEIRFGTTPGNPYQVIKSELISGPSPYIGNLAFYSRETTAGSLERRLRLSGGGALHSGPDNGTHVSGHYNYGAVNAKGFQNFIGYTSNAGTEDPANAPTISAYFTADNNDVSGAVGTGATAVYADAKVWNSNGAIGAEIDAQNMSGFAGRDINPNQIFGVSGGGRPWVVSMWTQSAGTLFEQSYDISAAIGIVQAIHTAGTLPKFRKGIVIDVNAIQDVGGHKEAIALPSDNEITWWDATGANIVRLRASGANAVLTAQSVLQSAANATTASYAIGSGATGDRSAYLFFGASSTGSNQDALFHRVGGANGQLQIQNSGTGSAVLILNGSNRLIVNGSAGDVALNSTTDTSSVSTGSLNTAGGLGLAKGLIGGTFARHGTYLNVGSTAAPTNTTAGDLTAVRGFFSGTTRIDGSLGVGGITPLSKLDVRAPSNDGFRITDSTGAQYRGWFLNIGDTHGEFRLYSGSTVLGTKFSANQNDNVIGGDVAVSGKVTVASATLLTTSIALTNGAAAAAGSLTNSPVAGNPTKWIPIVDNGTTRYIPAW